MADGPSRILVAEDNWFTATEMADMLAALGHQVVGPVPSLAEAERIAAAGQIDGAVLDLWLDGGEAVALARHLAERGTPVLLVSATKPPAEVSDLPVLTKPVGRDTFQAAARALFGQPPMSEREGG